MCVCAWGWPRQTRLPEPSSTGAVRTPSCRRMVSQAQRMVLPRVTPAAAVRDCWRAALGVKGELLTRSAGIGKVGVGGRSLRARDGALRAGAPYEVL